MQNFQLLSKQQFVTANSSSRFEISNSIKNSVSCVEMHKKQLQTLFAEMFVMLVQNVKSLRVNFLKTFQTTAK